MVVMVISPWAADLSITHSRLDGSTLLLHVNDHGVAAERQHQTFSFGLKMQNDATAVLKPQIPAAHIAYHEPIASLGVGARKSAEVWQIVDISGRIYRRRTNATDTQTRNGERVSVAGVEQRAAPPASISQVGRLNLVHLQRPVRRHTLIFGIRPRRLLTAGSEAKYDHKEQLRSC